MGIETKNYYPEAPCKILLLLYVLCFIKTDLISSLIHLEWHKALIFGHDLSKACIAYNSQADNNTDYNIPAVPYDAPLFIIPLYWNHLEVYIF